MVRRRKSIQDIREQVKRLRASNFSRTGEFETGRDRRIMEIGRRYEYNIAKAIGEERTTPMGNRYYAVDGSRKLGRSTYMGNNKG